MEAEDTDVVGPDVDQQEEKLPPLVSDDAPAPLDFSELTPCQFGISVQSFAPKLSSNCKDKSRVAQIKARRRSAIGTRGSPETNSLIRFMAQQRMKTPKASQTPELVRSSPFLPRVASTLRQKMASFQILMDVEESDACDPKPAQDSDADGCIRTRDYLSDGSSHDACKENNPPVTPTPSKRRRLGPHEGCSQEIREAGAPILHSSLKEQEVNKDPVIQDVAEAPLPSSGSAEEAHAVLVLQTLDANFNFSAHSPSKKQQDSVFEVQSPSRPPPVDPAAASPFHIPSLPSLLDMKPTGDDGSLVVKKKKQVRFGGPLSPEFFDKNLPPSTPLQKGGTPARAATPGGSFQLRSLLKTPQKSESKTPQSQLDLDSSTDFGASPTFSLPHKQGSESPQIVSPSVEEKDSAVTSNPECLWDTRPLNLNAAFQEESLSQTETAVVSLESDLQTSTSCRINTEEEPGSCPETKEQPEAAVEDPPSAKPNRRKKAGAEPAASVRSGSRKRKQPEESQPVKRSMRSAAKSASGKMKTASGGARRWSKDVDHSLYGSREYASKNPSLTPITENLCFISESPAAPQTPLAGVAATRVEAHQNPETDTSTAAVTEEAEVGNAARGNRRLSGPRARGRPLRKRKVSVPDRKLLSEEKENCEDQTAALGSQSEHKAPPQEDTEEVGALTSELTLCSNLEEKTDSAPASCEEPPSTELPLQKSGGRRSSALVPVLQEQQNHAAELQSTCEAERGPGDQAANQQENVPSGSAGQEEPRPPGELLAPWQDEFNFEDVFKPVTTRGQRSVRRSLRLRCDLDRDGAGLAWLPRTSPDSSREARRKTRGRRPSAALLIQPPLPEETQDAS